MTHSVSVTVEVSVTVLYISLHNTTNVEHNSPTHLHKQEHL